MDSLTVPGNPTCDERTCPSPTVADQRRTLTGFPEELPCAAVLRCCVRNVPLRPVRCPGPLHGTTPGADYRGTVLARWGIRIGMGLAGVALGILVSDAVLSGLSLTFTALVETTVIFWLIHIAVQFMALRVLIRQPSVALAGLLAIASTIVSLIIVNLIVSGSTSTASRPTSGPPSSSG